MKFAADENLNNEIIRRLQNRLPDIDIVRIQDSPVYQQADDIMLEWCANEGRILITHDQRTMAGFVFATVAKGLLVSGVLIVPSREHFKEVVEDIALIIADNNEAEWRDTTTDLPF
jgi:hypothetical protein